MTLKKKELGENGEKIAVRYLQSRGYRILERNYRIRLGEVDIIAEHGEDLVFIEVKTRSGRLFGSPFEAVTLAKQRQLSRVALEYISKRGYQNRPARFDVVGVQLKGFPAAPLQGAEVELVRNAFELCYGDVQI